MEFHFGYTETILFSFWKTTSVLDFAGSVLAIFLMGVICETTRHYREYLLLRTPKQQTEA